MTPSPDKLGIILRVGMYVLIGWLSLILFATLMQFVVPPDAYFLISALATFTAAALANTITVRIYERGRLSDLGLGWTPASAREFLIGAATASLSAIVILVGPLLFRVASFHSVPAAEHRAASIIFVSVVLLFGAVGEEMLFHGYAFQLLIRRLGAFATIFPAAILFGMAHLGNQNVTTLGIVNTVLWGILLGYAYYRTGALWLPIGLHFGWNVTLPLFGVNLSGFTMGVAGYALEWSAGTMWSGGAYGPEGSVLSTAVVVALFVAVTRLFPEPPAQPERLV